MKMMKWGKSDIRVSRAALGTWAIGGGSAWGENDDSQSIETIRGCLDVGINAIDTAPAYNFGHSEEVIGKALVGIREKVVISTKCGLVWDGQEGSLFQEKEGKRIVRNLSKESIKQEVEKSLRRLGTDYIDLYITHWQSIEPYVTPIAETMEALMELKQEGKIKAIGASNVNADQIKEYVKYGQLDVIQEKYNILDRRAEKDLLPLCENYNITFQAYSPLEQGLLTGGISKDFVPQTGSARHGKYWFDKGRLTTVIEMLEQWEDLCEKYSVTKGNLAIAWILFQSPLIQVLCGARSLGNLQENAKALNVQLSKEDAMNMRSLAENITKQHA